MCAGYITASLCTWNYRRMWFFKWSFDRSRCIMPTNRSLTDDHRLITLINAFIRARDQRTYRALRGRTVQVLRGPTPITAPSLEVRCVLIRGDALWSCDPNPFFFFCFSFEQWRRKFKGVNQWFFIEQRGHTEFGSFFFLRQKSHSLKREKWEIKSRNIRALKLIFSQNCRFLLGS